jgi:MFS family permease
MATPIRRIHLINFSRKLTVNTVFFLIPLYFLKIGLNGWQIGFIVSLYGLAPLLFSFPTGWLNDRFSIIRIIQAALAALSLLFLLIGWTANFYLLAIIFLLLGMANNALDVSLNSLYYKDETDMDLNKKYSLLAFWLSLGTATGTLLGGVLTYYYDFRMMFFIYSVFLLIILLGVKNIGQERFFAVPLKEYRLNLFNRKTILFAIMIFVLTLHWGAEGTVYSPFLREFFGLNNLQISLYISLPLFALALSSFFIGLMKYNDLKNKNFFLSAMFLSGVGHIFMVNNNVYISFFFRVVHEIGDGFLGALVVVYISRLFEKRSIGGSSGILLATMTLGHMVGALVFSPLGQNVGLQYPFLISGSLLVLNTGFAYFVFRKVQY